MSHRDFARTSPKNAVIAVSGVLLFALSHLLTVAGTRQPAAVVDIESISVRRVTISPGKRWLEDHARDLSIQSGLRIRIADDVRNRPITVAASTTLERVMEGIAIQTGYEWREKPPGGPDGSDYLLARSESRLAFEAALIDASERTEGIARRQGVESLLSSISRAINGTGLFSSGLGALLEKYDGVQRRKAAESAHDSIAGGGARVDRGLLFASPFRELSRREQDAVRSILSRLNSDTGHPNVRFAAPTASEEEVEDSIIGIIASGGSLRLGVVAPGSKEVWASPTEPVYTWPRKAVDSGPEALTDTHLMRLPVLDIATMPRAIRTRRVAVTAPGVAGNLDDTWKSLGTQTKMPIFADSFARRRPNWRVYEPGAVNRTLEEFLVGLAHNYQLRILYKRKALHVHSRTLGYDMRAEPPPAVISHFKRLKARSIPLRFDDFLMLGKLSPLQFQTIIWGSMQGVGHELQLRGTASSLYPVLVLAARLTSDERQLSESSDGLAADKMSSETTKLFHDVCDRGIPTNDELVPPPATPGFTIRRYGVRGTNEGVSFVVSSPRGHTKVYSLSIP